jgi:hypothetical protein
MAKPKAQPVAAWAASLGETHMRVQRKGSGQFLNFKPDESFGVTFAAVVLPPGTRAAALGRSVLTPGTADWQNANLPQPQGVNTRVPAWCAQLLMNVNGGRLDSIKVPSALDTPVWVDPTDGKIVDVIHEGIEQELAPYYDIAVSLWKADQSHLAPLRAVAETPKMAKRFFGAIPAGIQDLVNDVKNIGGDTNPVPVGIARPDDSTHPPIEGVGYQTWITVRSLLVRDDVHPLQLETFTTWRGVPGGRWAAIDAAWEQRSQQDPAVAAWMTYDFGHLKLTGAQWQPYGAS